MASSKPGKPELFVIVTETTLPSAAMTTSTSATRVGSLSGFVSGRFCPMRARKLSVQRLCT